MRNSFIFFIRPYSMVFRDRLSKRQGWAILLLIFGFVLIFKPNNLISNIKELGIIIIIISFYLFISEFIRKYKISSPFKKNYYDSKEEEKIAEYFKRKNLIYYHHPKIRLNKFSYGFYIPFYTLEIEPDFFLPEFKIYVEYWGMIENQDYKRKSYDFKTKLYKDNGIEFISLYPKNLNNLEWDFTMKLLDIFKEREGIIRTRR